MKRKKRRGGIGKGRTGGMQRCVALICRKQISFSIKLWIFRRPTPVWFPFKRKKKEQAAVPGNVGEKIRKVDSECGNHSEKPEWHRAFAALLSTPLVLPGLNGISMET